jgi:hypothetical protein
MDEHRTAGHLKNRSQEWLICRNVSLATVVGIVGLPIMEAVAGNFEVFPDFLSDSTPGWTLMANLACF